MKLQISIEKLERIIDSAKRAKEYNSSLSDTLEIEVTKQTDSHNGSDTVGVIIQSSYQDANGKSIFWN